MVLAVLGASGVAFELRHATAQEATATIVMPAQPTVRPKPRPLVWPVTPMTQDAATAVLDQPVPPEVVPPDAAVSQPVPDPGKGPVTTLPLPRYVSLKGNVGNARRGPGLTHRIDWVFTHSGMPLRVTAEHDNWRRVEDSEGMGGWVHYALLSGVRMALITQDIAEFHPEPSADSEVIFKAEAGVIGRVLECSADWCRLNVQGDKGWLPKSQMWGADPGEIVE
jgi:SH3-like domain-containing protein